MHKIFISSFTEHINRLCKYYLYARHVFTTFAMSTFLQNNARKNETTFTPSKIGLIWRSPEPHELMWAVNFILHSHKADGVSRDCQRWAILHSRREGATAFTFSTLPCHISLIMARILIKIRIWGIQSILHLVVKSDFRWDNSFMSIFSN